MKEIIHNSDNLTESDINNYIDRAKMVVENGSGELLLASTKGNYYLIGGHVENNESFDECVVREIKEESGVDIPIEKRTPFFSIKYYCKDYPEKGLNTRYITNYYSIKYDLVPNMDIVNLTEDEKNGGFKLEYISKDIVLDFLNKSLENCSKEAVTRDTIDALKIYLENK